MFAWIRGWWKAFVEKGAYPDDPDERCRIKAHILGAGAAVGKQGPVKVEVDDGKDNK